MGQAVQPRHRHGNAHHAHHQRQARSHQRPEDQQQHDGNQGQGQKLAALGVVFGKLGKVVGNGLPARHPHVQPCRFCPLGVGPHIPEGFARAVVQRNLGHRQRQGAVCRLGAQGATVLCFQHPGHARHIPQTRHEAVIGGLALRGGQRGLAARDQQHRVGVFFTKLVGQQRRDPAALGVGQAPCSLGRQRPWGAGREGQAEQHQRHPEQEYQNRMPGNQTGKRLHPQTVGQTAGETVAPCAALPQRESQRRASVPLHCGPMPRGQP